MALEDLNEQLHSRGFHQNRGESSPYDPRSVNKKEAAHPEFTQTEKWQAPEPPVAPVRQPGFFARLGRTQRLILLGGGGALFLVILSVGLFVMRGRFFNEENIQLGINGPANVQSAEKAVFTFTYANKNWSALKDAVLVLSYPETFALEPKAGAAISRSQAEIRLGEIGARAEGVWDFAGTFSGFQGDLAYLKASLRYIPSGLSSSFTKETQLSVQVAATPLGLEIAAPQEMSSGQEIAYVIDYRNDDDRSYSDIRLQMEYPAEFRYLSAIPQASEGDSIWYLGTLSPGQSGKITIRGTLSGSQNDNKKVRALLGRLEKGGNFLVQNEREGLTRINTSPLVISQSVNGLANVTVNAGDTLNYQIIFRNEGSVGLRDAIITLELDSPYLDYSQLSLQSGTYDQNRKMIIWKASDLPALAKIEPGAQGKVSFFIPVLRTFALNTNEKNIFVRSVAKIDSVDLPTPIGQNKIIGSNTLLVKLNSLVIPTLRAFYNDQVFPNSGPLPPVVGRETTYTIHVRVTNTPNDVTRARLTLALPASVDYKGKLSPVDESVLWNERAGELIWDMGVLAPGKDRELVFRAGITPGPNDIGKAVVLVNGGTFIGLDTYTKEEIKVIIGRKNNYIPEDSAAQEAGNEVKTNE